MKDFALGKRTSYIGMIAEFPRKCQMEILALRGITIGTVYFNGVLEEDPRSDAAVRALTSRMIEGKRRPIK